MTGAPPQPQFCPWCGSPVAYEEHGHQPRYAQLEADARSRGADPPPLPERVKQALDGETYVTGCPGCRVVSHVIGHRAEVDPG